MLYVPLIISQATYICDIGLKAGNHPSHMFDTSRSNITCSICKFIYANVHKILMGYK